MPTPIPTPTAADATGLDDSQWIKDVRIGLRDSPVPVNETWTADGTGGVFGASTTPYLLTRGPIYDGEPVGTYVKVTNTTDSVNYTVVAAPTVPTAGQVAIDYNARTLTFFAVPAVNKAMAFGYYTCRWTDYSILGALYAGLRAMFPSVGKVYVDSSVQIAVNTWDYTLPVWAQSPDSQIAKVEFKHSNIATEPWRPLSVWSRTGIDQLHIPQAGSLSPASRLRITGWGTYLRLADLEPDLYELPIWYAFHLLNARLESKRIREDTIVPMAQEGGEQPGLLLQAGMNYKRLFDDVLKEKKRAYGPPGAARPIVTTYQMARHI